MQLLIMELKKFCLSTDKAVYPINAMGISKASWRRLLLQNLEILKIQECLQDTVMLWVQEVLLYRYFKQIESGKPLTITDPNMTRFMMTLDNAVELVIYAFENGENGEIFVQKTPAAKIEVLANAICKFRSKNKHEIKILGTRHGEKHEVLLSREERSKADELENILKLNQISGI